MKKYAVFLETIDGIDISRVTEAITRARGIPIFKASKKMAGLTGIVEENMNEKTAQNLVFHLKNNGILAFMIEMEKTIKLLTPTEVHKGIITNESLHLESISIQKGIEKIDIPWDKILLLACARVRAEEIVKKTGTECKITAVTRGGGVIVRQVPVQKKVSRSKWVNLLDILSSEPGGLFRVEAESFNFSSLGLLKLMPTHYQNLVQFIRVLAERATMASMDTSIKFILDGSPLTNLKTPSIKSYHDHVRWALQMACIRKNS